MVKRRSRSTYHLIPGDHAELSVTYQDFITITASKPVLVQQYSTTRQSNTRYQNTYMTLLPSTEQCGKHHYVAVLYENMKHIHIVLPRTLKNGILINNVLISNTHNHHSETYTFINVPGYNYTTVRVTLQHLGLHNISHSSPGVCMCVMTQGYPVDINLTDYEQKLSTLPNVSLSTWPKLVSSSSSHYDVLPLVSAHQEQPLVINKAAINSYPQTKTTWQSRQDNHVDHGFNATVIAVIMSLSTAVFFVIACIVGFVVAEFACGRESIFSGAKVSPSIEQ